VRAVHDTIPTETASNKTAKIRGIASSVDAGWTW
jgi:hypothetical protein